MRLVVRIFLCCAIWISLVVFGHSEEEKEALIFNRFTEMPVRISQNIAKDAECGAWAVACPAETAAEKDFIKRYSFTKNALFVKAVYSKGSVKAFEVKNKICKKFPRISLMYKVKSYTFQFGFEVYFELNDAEFFHLDTSYGDYKTPEGVYSALRTKFKKGIFEMKEYYRIIKNAFGVDVIKEFWFNEDTRLGFTWLYLFKISFDLSKKILRMVWYQIEYNSRWTMGVKCDKYTLGWETYEGISANDVNDLYRNQEKIFRGLKVPENTCLPDYNCLTKWLLVPIDQFRFGSSVPAVCSNMATIPIWREKVEKALIKVDTFLYTLFQVIKEPLMIISGVHAEYELPRKNGLGKSKLYLDSEYKKIPVPKIIYKIVEYRPKDCLLSDEKCTYSAIIIIHNDPFFKSSDRVCTQFTDVTSTWGWELLKTDIDGNESQIVYVCENDKKLLKKLSISQKHIVAGGLDLYNFPFLIDTRVQFHTKNIKYIVEQQFKEFHENGDNPNLDEDDIVERVHSPSNFEDPEVLEHIKEVEITEGQGTKSGEDDQHQKPNTFS